MKLETTTYWYKTKYTIKICLICNWYENLLKLQKANDRNLRNTDMQVTDSKTSYYILTILWKGECLDGWHKESCSWIKKSPELFDENLRGHRIVKPRQQPGELAWFRDRHQCRQCTRKPEFNRMYYRGQTCWYRDRHHKDWSQ